MEERINQILVTLCISSKKGQELNLLNNLPFLKKMRNEEKNISYITSIEILVQKQNSEEKKQVPSSFLA